MFFDTCFGGCPNITATYPGDANYNGSSDTETHQVNKANTTAAISDDQPDPTFTGQGYTVTAAVSVTAQGSATPTARPER